MFDFRKRVKFSNDQQLSNVGIYRQIYYLMFLRQFKAIQTKNWRLNIKGREFLRQNVSVLILAVFIVISERSNPNSFTTPFYLAIAITSYSRAVATWWLTEKETHQKELQSTMGVTYPAYLLSWLFYFICNGIIISTIMLVITRLLVITDDTKFAEGYGFSDLVPLYYLFMLANLGFVLLLSCFFDKAKTGAQAITFIQLIATFLYFLRFSNDLAGSEALTTFLSIFPQMAFNMGVANIAFLFPDYTFSFTYSRSNITLFLLFIVYTLLALYLEQVLPSQLGTNKHPLFFLGIGKDPVNQGPVEPLLEDDDEGASSAKYEEQIERRDDPLIKMKGVVKEFGQQRAVDGLTVNFYGGEIFCLLGHNGAGKSTTINLLTGLLKATEGDIKILGLKYPGDLDEIRQNIGLCLQFNVLYDMLTVEEHLEFYYRLKKEEDDQCQRAVNETIHQCALDSEKGKLAKNLSGGNKRKLCLAISIIGGSKVLFLDQPSSGLDPNSRQSIWNILRGLASPERCIILTTHHLQQAEALSRRIGIMSKGQLVILGSPAFITKQFSVGYRAVITLNRELDSASNIARQIITKYLSGTTQDKQTAKNTLKFVLPLSQAPNFADAFKALEQAKVGSLSVTMSNLQDAFVRIGEEEDSFTEGFEQLNASQEELIPSEKRQKEKDEQMVLPEVHCEFSFWSQFKGVLVRKALTVIRSFSTVVSIAMPVAFMSIGALVVCLAIPNNETDEQKKVTLDRIRLFLLSYFMVWAFIFNTSSYCGNLVLERQKRFKYLSNVSGLRQAPYWAANYCFDLVLFLCPLVVFFIVIGAIGEQASFVTRFAGLLVSILIIFGFSFIGYSYLFSFIFQKSSTAFRFFPFLNLIFFYFLPNIPTIVAPQGILAQYVMPFLTPFVALSAFFNTQEVVGSSFGQTMAYNKIWVPYIALLLQTGVYLFATLYLQRHRFSLKERKGINEDIRMEGGNRESVEQGPIRVSHLSKVYGNGKVALRDNSFTVSEGQIFGLLGPNGAGKSTSFNIITAALPKTQGSVQLFGQEVNRGIMQIFEQVGVCPQYNPMYEKLTVREHLLYFCRVKGLPEDIIPSTIDFYSKLLSLEPYLDKKAGVLSGGNKRKMCVAMAMVGNPRVGFFDQPSAGVDPISRRYLWKCLAASTQSKKTSMVLTTHSMNQAESLCARIGILIKGQFVCLDSPAALKQQYGRGYRANIVADPSNHPELEQIFKSQFGAEIHIEKLETDPKHIVFVIPSERFKLSLAFELMQNRLLGEDKIESYEIRESTLEEVFIFLSRLQPVEEEENYDQPWELLCWEWGLNGCQLVL